MITITILFFANNKNKYLILVQMQVSHESQSTENCQAAGGGVRRLMGKEEWEERAPQLTFRRWE